MAISANAVVVGAPGDDDKGASSGSAYVFARRGSTWTQHAKILAKDGAAGDSFAFDVAIDGGAVVIAATSDGDRGDYSGSAYVFTLSATPASADASVSADAGITVDAVAPQSRDAKTVYDVRPTPTADGAKAAATTGKGGCELGRAAPGHDTPSPLSLLLLAAGALAVRRLPLSS